jgi:hypothetical protein
MITRTFSLRFSDGQMVTARIQGKAKTEDVPVSYSGLVERLPLNEGKASAIELRAYFQSFARELRAEFVEQENDDRLIATSRLDEALEQLLEVKALKSLAH